MDNTFDPKKLLVILGGKQIEGFSEDSMVSVEPMGEGITSVVGADGSVSRSMDPDTRVKVTITLMGTSKSNDVLSALHLLDRSTGKGAVPLLIKDLMGSTLIAAQYAWVTQFPSADFAKTVSDREWVLETGSSEIFMGGSS